MLCLPTLRQCLLRGGQLVGMGASCHKPEVISSGVSLIMKGLQIQRPYALREHVYYYRNEILHNIYL